MNKGIKKNITKLNFINIALLTVFVFALGLRFYVNIYHVVMVPDYDGYQYIKIAKNLKNGVLVKEAINWTIFFPFLINFFSFIPLPYDELGSLINIFFGTLTIFPVYYIVKSIFNEEAGLIACIFYASEPSIAHVDVQVMSEPTYIFMLFLMALLFLKSYESNFQIINVILAGIFSGIVYLSRPEGTIVYLLLLAYIIAFWHETFKNKLKFAILNFLISFVAIMPYMFFLRKELGKFVFSGKSVEIIPHIRNMIGLSENLEGFFQVFFYDTSKSYQFLLKNLQQTILLITEVSSIKSVICIFLLFFFFVILRKSSLGFFRSLIFFFILLTQFVGAMIFKIDYRYLSPTMSVFMVILGVGFYGVYYHILKNFQKDKVIIIALIFIYFGYGYYKVYEIFEKKGEINIMFEQERLYKFSGEWLKNNIPKESKIISSSTNYLIAYYADRDYENISKNLTEDEVIQILCDNSNNYLVINEYAVSRYYKNLSYLLNPYSFSFYSSKLYKYIVPIYFDDKVGLAIYKCKSK